MKRSGAYRQTKKAVVGIFLGLFSGLSTATAGSQHSSGSMVITFHNHKINRTKSEGFYVVQESGLVKWQNFRDQEEPGTDPRKVYLITTKDQLATIRNSVEKQTARK